MNALILVDLQNDFCAGGALAVPNGEQVVPIVNRIQSEFDLVVATQDWHPRDHASFAINHPGKQPFETIELHGREQTLWPAHCVQGTHGAELHPLVDRSRIAKVFPKGTDREVDSYSGFFDNDHQHSTGLGDWLKGQGVASVYVCGLATDYCVKFTALDAVGLGFRVWLIEDASRGVNLAADDSLNAMRAMQAAGVRVAQSNDLQGANRTSI